MDNEKIGKYIRELRIKANLTQNQLAEMIPISRQAVSKWERGKTIPDSQTLIILGKIFNVSIDSLLLGEKVEKKQQLEKLKLDIVDEYNIKNKKIKKLYISMVIIFLVFVITFLAYYFINTYNTIKIYSVSGENGDTLTKDGLLILSRDNVYFRLGDVFTNKEIEKMELYYKNNTDKLIFSTKDDTIFLRDYQGYNSYFEFNPYTDDIKNIYLRIYYSESDYEDIELQFIKEFANDKLFFKNRASTIVEDENKDSSTIEGIQLVEDNKLIKMINEKFDCVDDVCSMNVDNINFVYFVDSGLLIIQDGDSKEWTYYTDGKILIYTDYDKEEDIEITLDKNLKDKELELYLDFYENYISKYILN